MKLCIKCNIESPPDMFFNDKSKKDGLSPYCKTCAAVDNRARYLKNRQPYLDRSREQRERNPEKAAEYARAYYLENRDKIIQRSNDWRSADPERRSSERRNRRARIASSPGTHTPAEILELYKRQSGLCANCLSKLKRSGPGRFHADHIMPLALGGSNLIENIQCLCPSCNMRKSAKHPDDWAKENGRLL